MTTDPTDAPSDTPSDAGPPPTDAGPDAASPPTDATTGAAPGATTDAATDAATGALARQQELARKAIVPALLVVLAVVACWPLLTFDARLTAGAPDAAVALTETPAPAPLADRLAGWRLSSLSLQLDAALWSGRPWGHYLLDVLLHLAGVLLLAWIVASIADDWWLAAGVAGIAAAHPAALAAVAELEGRATLVGNVALLGAFACYLRGLAAPRADATRIAWAAGALLAYAVALSEQPAALALGPLALLHGRLFVAPERRARALPLIACGMAVLALAAAHGTGLLVSPTVGFRGDYGALMLAGPGHLGQLLGLAVWPGLPVGFDLAAPGVAAGAIGLAGLTAAVVGLLALTRGDCLSLKLAAFGGAWFALVWLGTAGVLGAAPALFDGRQLALPIAGLALVVLGLLRRLAGERRDVVPAAVGLLLAVALAGRTHLLARHFESPDHLWAAAAARDNGSLRAEDRRLATAWQDHTERFRPREARDALARAAEALERARPHVETSSLRTHHERLSMVAARLDISRAGVELALAPGSYAARKQALETWLARAAKHLVRAEGELARSTYRDPEAHAAARARRAHLAAEIELVRASWQDPVDLAALDRAWRLLETAHAHAPLPEVLASMAQVDLIAVQAYDRLVLLPSIYPAPSGFAAIALASLVPRQLVLRVKRVEEARARLEQALAQRPQYERALTQLGIILHDYERKPQEALRRFAAALAAARTPRDRKEIRRRMARVYMGQGELASAEQQWTRLLELDKRDLEARKMMAEIRILDRRWQEAIVHLEQLIVDNLPEGLTPDKAPPEAGGPLVYEARARLAEVYRAYGDKRFQEVLALVRARRAREHPGPVHPQEVVEAMTNETILEMIDDASRKFIRAYSWLKSDRLTRNRMAQMGFWNVLSVLRFERSTEPGKALYMGIAELIDLMVEFPEFEPALRHFELVMKVMMQKGEQQVEPVLEIVEEKLKDKPDNPSLKELKRILLVWLEALKGRNKVLEQANAAIAAGKGTYEHYWIVAKHLAELAVRKQESTKPREGWRHTRAQSYAYFRMAVPLCHQASKRKQIVLDMGSFQIRYAKLVHGELKHTLRQRWDDGLHGFMAHVARHSQSWFCRRLLTMRAAYLRRAEGGLKPLWEANKADLHVANNLAMVYQFRNKPDQAIAVLGSVDNVPPHMRQLLAEMLFKRAIKEDYPEVKQRKPTLARQVADLEKAVALRGASAPAHYRTALHDRKWLYLRQRGIAAWKGGRHTEAVTLLRAALKADTRRRTDFRCNYHLGQALAETGDLDGAAGALQIAHAVKPKEWDVLRALADVYVRRDKGTDLRRAYRHYSDLLDQIRTDKAVARLFPDLQAHAEGEIRKIVATRNAAYEAGRKALGAGKYEDAARSYRRCLAIRPEPDARKWLGVSLYYLRQFDEAIAQLEKVRKAHGEATAPSTMLWLGRAYRLNGKPAEARAVLEAALKLADLGDAMKAKLNQELGKLEQ